MYKFKSQTKGLGKTFDVVLSGGSPWGFTLQGGSEFRTKLTVQKVTPGGKADLSQAIAVGDEIVAVNGIECQSRAEAIELVRCSRQKLNIALKREGGVVPEPANHSNGGAVKKNNEVPNLYKTASEILSSSDFYSTFNVDKQRFAKITQNKKPSNMYDSSDNLSASHENLLESYRQAEKKPNISNSSIMEEASQRLSRSSTEIANGRTSPAEVDGLRRINSLNNVTGKRFHSNTGLLGAAQFSRPGTEIYGRTWSLRRGASLPEGHWPVMHQRTLTSPGRIQKVTVKSTNIAVSPTGREADNHQTARSGGNVKNPDDWVSRWLKDAPQHVAQSASLDYRDMTDTKISLQERSDVNKSQSLPRSKSFGGPTSYGVTVTATGVKWNESSNTTNHARGPQRYSSPILMQEKQLRDARPNDTSSRQPEMPWHSLTYASPGDTVEVRLPRDIRGPKMTSSESTSSLDSVGTMDSSVGGARKQCPAPPPRRSKSILLSSFKTKDRRRLQEEVHIPQRSAAVARIPEVAADQPKHSVSRSWPTDHVAESKPAGSEVTRLSWHAEAPSYSARAANASISSTSSDVTPERKLSKSSSQRYSASVVIRNMRSSSSSSFEEKSTAPTVYRSGPMAPEAEQVQPSNRSSTLPPRLKFSEVAPPVKSPGDVGRWPPQNEPEAEKPRIEDTKILQRIMKDMVTNVETSPSVRSRIANFEGGMKQTGDGTPARERPLFQQHRSFSHGKIDMPQEPLKESRISQSSSMDSLLETRSPTRFRTSSFAEQQISTPVRGDTRPSKQWETNDYLGHSRSDENYKRPSHVIDVKSNPGTREPRPNFESTSPGRLETSPVRLERQQSLEEQPFVKFESSAREENKVNSAMERTAPVNEKPLLISNHLKSDLIRKLPEEESRPPSNNDENEVFWDADDSFPPPPPLVLSDPLETSQDSLPLPSPPREVLLEFPPPYNDYDSRRNDPVEKETYQQNGKYSSDIIKSEETAFVESSVGIGEQPRIELNGPGKIDASGVSDQAFELSSSTDLSSKDTSPVESKKMNSSPRAPPPPPLVLTSTPTKDEPDQKGSYLDVSNSPYSGGSNTSTPSDSRPNSLFSPKLVELDKEKADLVESMKQKIIDLRSQMDEIKDEIDGNEELGQKVTKVVEQKASEAEFSKYQRFTGELNKIIGLLLILTQRMHRYEMMLNDLDMSEEADRQQRDILQEKIEKVAMQHEEACKIKEVNDKRGEVVSKILENCLEEEDYADFKYYIDMKTQLALMHAEIRDKVKMGEEKLNTLHSTKIDWSILSLA